MNEQLLQIEDVSKLLYPSTLLTHDLGSGYVEVFIGGQRVGRCLVQVSQKLERDGAIECCQRMTSISHYRPAIWTKTKDLEYSVEASDLTGQNSIVCPMCGTDHGTIRGWQEVKNHDDEIQWWVRQCRCGAVLTIFND